MKKLLLILLLITIIFNTSAQVVSSCQTTYLDTLKYVDQVKTSSWSAIPANVTNDGGAYGYAGYGQRFEAPDSVKVLGFSFRGFVFSGAADTVVCRLYEANGSGLPGVQIDSVIHTVPLVSGFTSPLDADAIMNTVMFGSGHILEGDYIVTVENFSTSNMYIVRNNDGDGVGEDLCMTFYRGLSDPSFDGWYSTFPFGTGWNFDMPFEPIIEYSFDSELTISADSICGSDALIVFDTIVSFDDSILYNKMYNPNFASYTGYNTSVNYDYGDGNSDDLGSHIYTAGGDYSVLISDTILATGWTNDYFLSSCNSLLYVFPIPDLGPDTTICLQSSIDLSPGEFDSYNWSTLEQSDSITIGHLLDPGDTILTVDVMKGICSYTESIMVTVSNNSIPDLGSDTALCMQALLDLSPGVFDSYDWSTGQQTNSIAIGPISDSGVTIYSVDVITGICSYTSEITVTVNQIPDLGLDTSICLQSSIVLSPGEFDSYNWSTLEQSDSITIGPLLSPGDTTLTVDVMTGICSYTSEITVTVNQIPDLGPDTTLCMQSSIILSPGEFDSYNWSTLEQSDSITFGPLLVPGDTTLTVDVMTGICSYTESIMVTVSNNPIPNLGSDTTLCLQAILDISPGVFDTYDWSTGQQANSITIGPISGSGVTTYSVDVMTGICSYTSEITVTVNQIPDLGPDTTLCIQSSLILSPGVFDTYSWNTGQLTDSIIAGPILNPGVITYAVDVTSALCNSTASITITFDNCIGIEEINNHSLHMYPNPANDNFTINTDFTQNYELKIYDNQGKIVMVQEMIGTVKNIDVSVLEQGVYILEISKGNQVVRKKLQILR